MNNELYRRSAQEQKSLIRNKNFQRLVAAVGVTVALTAITACSQEKHEKPFTPTPIVQSAERYPEIGLYYPSLTNFAVRETGQTNTERSSTKWLNLSSANFDSSIASKAIDYFENLARSRKDFIYQFSGQSIPLVPDVKPRTNRVIFLISQQAPNPDWPDAAYTAATTGFFKDSPYVSFVRVYDVQQDIPQSKVFTTTEKEANKALAVELCQSIISLRSITTEMANLGQEIFCNSWGAAFTLRQYGLNYNQYTQWATAISISPNPKSPSYPLYVLTKSDYEQIPNIGPIIKK